MREARIVIKVCRQHHNMVGPNRSPGYKPPAPAVFVPALTAPPAAPPATPPFVPRPTLN